MVPALPNLRRTALVVVCAFGLSWALVLWASARANGGTGPIDGDPFVFRAWTHWDADWYAAIAKTGYSYSATQQSPVAYFPLYPMVIRALTWLGLSAYVAGVLLTVASGAIALWVFSRWARRLSTPLQAEWGLLTLALYPFSVFLFGAMYSDALFLMLVVLAFDALERDDVVLATFIGALATACRPVAPAVVCGLLVRRLELRRAKGEALTPYDFIPVFAGAGLGLYMLFLYASFGDPVAFVHAQGADGWGHVPGWETWFKKEFFMTFTRISLVSVVAVRFVAHAGFTLLALALVWPIRKRLGWGYAVYVAMAVGIPALSSKDLHGLGRYVIAAFPCFLVGAMMLSARPKLMKGALAVGLLGQAAVAWLLGSHHYVA